MKSSYYRCERQQNHNSLFWHAWGEIFAFDECFSTSRRAKISTPSGKYDFLARVIQARGHFLETIFFGFYYGVDFNLQVGRNRYMQIDFNLQLGRNRYMQFRLQFAGGSKSLYVISTSIWWLNQRLFFVITNSKIFKKSIKIY